LAEAWKVYLMAVDVMEILADWQQFRRTETGASVRTSCILPSGSLLNVSVQPAMDGWIVCDEGSVVADVESHGFDVAGSLRGLASKLTKLGLNVQGGKIYSNRVSTGDLPYAVAYLATSALDASRWLMNAASKSGRPSVADGLRSIVDGRFHDYRMTEPLTLTGKSSKPYSFDNVLLLPSNSRLILDPVTRHDGSIKSRLVANLDVAQAGYDNLVQRIVYDADDGWEQQELALLTVGAPTIKLSRLAEVVERMVA
jgi:hypothetical protein